MDLLIAAALVGFCATGASSLQCYQCFNDEPSGSNVSTPICSLFDFSDKYIVECPHSTMCMKHAFELDIQNGVTIKGVIRNCAPQKYVYHDYVGGRWQQKMEIQEPYREGCEEVDDKGERLASSRYCYCRGNLCNAAPAPSAEGYTDIMGVIVVFNLMKYINSLR